MNRLLLVTISLSLALLPAACQPPDQVEGKTPRPSRAMTNWASKLADASRQPEAQHDVYDFSSPDTGPHSAIINACESQAAHIQYFCDTVLAIKRQIPVKIYPSIEEKGLALENTQPVQIQWQAPVLSIVSSPYFGVDQLGPQNALLLRQLLGQPATMVLEDGLSVYFNPSWQQKGHQHWAGRLLYKGNLPPLQDLITSAPEAATSTVVYRAAAASFTQYLLDTWGRKQFLRAYASWVPKPEEIPELEKGWHSWLRPLSTKPSPPAKPLPYLKGFNFAHEGYSIFNGYGSDYAEDALKKQAKLGANAIAIVPYSYMRNPNRPSPLPIMQRAGTETDEGVIRDAILSRKLGLQVVLKPQIWLGGGNWPGDVEMKTQEDWDAFFQHYYRWMRHYALLAEIHGIDVLCVGVEFAKATLRQPERWVQLIDKLRGIYGGPMTYAANWGTEFEALTFWEQLDYIGLDCYYPLSPADAPTDEELTQAFTEKLDMARRICQDAGRPLLLTEIGFTSTPYPWRSPHEDGRGRPYDGAAQKRCYNICMDVLAAREDWLRGVLWWKFPSDLSEGGQKHTGFTPNNKPIEEILPGLFQRLP